MDEVEPAVPERRQRSFRTFLRLFLPLAAIVVAGAAMFAVAESDRELGRLGAEEKFAVGLSSGSAARGVHWIVRDLAFLAIQPGLKAAINAPTAANLEALAAAWKGFASAQQDYDQIRWIDEDGMERVRVEYADGKARALPAEQLQYKGDRYYVGAGRRLGLGEIFVSPLDLNIEREGIEVPQRPTIRVGMPLADDRGTRRGMVLLNYHAQRMLQDFQAAAATIADHVMLLNTQGYWLHSPEPAQQWGFMFGRSETLGARHPAEWARIRDQLRGQFESEAGLWTFDTVRPLAGAHAVSIAPDVAPGGGGVGAGQDYAWKVVSLLPAPRLAAVRHAELAKAFAAALLVLALLGFGVSQFALSVGRRVEVARALVRRTRELEEAQRIARVGSWEWLERGSRITWSSELQRLFGREPASGSLGRDEAVRHLARRSVLSLSQAARTTLAGGTPFELDVEIIRADGSHGWVTARGERLLDDAGRVIGLRGTVHDITERKRMQDRLAEAQKLEGIGQLTGGLAHDFNNLLGIILGNLDLLEPLLAHDGQAFHYRSLAWRAAKRGAQITKSLLAIARKQTLEPRKLVLAEALAEMMPLIEQSVGKRIRVTLACADGRCGEVQAYVDPGGLGNAILNLVVNARDAMPSGGTLQIGLALRDIGPDASEAPADLVPGRYAILSVADNGSGMPEAVAARAFEPFFTTKPRGQGTGLGLAMVYGFARQSGGTATISTEAGAGTTVSLYLPAVVGNIDGSGAAAADPQAQHVSPEAKPADAGVRASGEAILVVDDEEMLLEVTYEWLRRLGYRVGMHASPVEALESLRGQRFDLLLTDATMPEMGGLDLAERARMLQPGIRIMVTSGFAEDLAQCGWPVLEKPYSRDQLAQAVRRSLDGPAPRRPAQPPHPAVG